MQLRNIRRSRMAAGVARRIASKRPRLHSPGVRAQYAHELRLLHQLERYLEAAHPEWPGAEVARETMEVSSIALELNAEVRRRLCWRGRRALISHERWILRVRERAARLLPPPDGDGTAGVREPRRPTPTPSTLAAEVEEVRARASKARGTACNRR